MVVLKVWIPDTGLLPAEAALLGRALDRHLSELEERGIRILHKVNVTGKGSAMAADGSKSRGADKDSGQAFGSVAAQYEPHTRF